MTTQNNATPTQEEAEEQIDNAQEAEQFAEKYREGKQTVKHNEDDNRVLEYNLMHTKKEESALYVVLIEKDKGEPVSKGIAGGEWVINDD